MSPRPTAQQYKIALLGGEYATAMTCEESNCEAWRRGWINVIDPTNREQAEFGNDLRRVPGLRYYEFRSESALEEITKLEGNVLPTVRPEMREAIGNIPSGMVVFLFPPGQRCFKTHEDREVVFVHRRSPAVEPRLFQRPLEFNESFNEQGYAVNRALERG